MPQETIIETELKDQSSFGQHEHLVRPCLRIVPIDFSEACEFIRKYHRHHKPPVGHKFSIACAVGENVVGVATIGRPIARRLDDGWTLEVNRLATDGTKNACSMLYAAAWRTARAMGYRKLITYILETETGTSLRAAGWKCIGKTGGLSWNVPSRPRVDKCPQQMKVRYEMATA
jgi:hypothetical protein